MKLASHLHVVPTLKRVELYCGPSQDNVYVVWRFLLYFVLKNNEKLGYLTLGLLTDAVPIRNS
jgi:hypothetical protein